MAWLFGVGEEAGEDVLQGDLEVVKEAALKAGHHGRPLFFGHLPDLPVPVDGIDGVELKDPVRQEILLHHSVGRVRDPILPDTAKLDRTSVV